MPESFSYRDAGVDIDQEAAGIRALIAALTFRRKGRFSMMGSVGHFAGLIDFGEMSLALTVDGVGTKMLVADRAQDWSSVGIDCIAMNVNDLYVMNMEPVAFVDYIATDSISMEKMAQIGRGLNEGARLANIDIVGGETATLKNLVAGLDLAGTCLGIQKKGQIITGDRVVPGDPSHGEEVYPQVIKIDRPVPVQVLVIPVVIRVAGQEMLPGERLEHQRVHHDVRRGSMRRTPVRPRNIQGDRVVPGMAVGVDRVLHGRLPAVAETPGPRCGGGG